MLKCACGNAVKGNARKVTGRHHGDACPMYERTYEVELFKTVRAVYTVRATSKQAAMDKAGDKLRTDMTDVGFTDALRDCYPSVKEVA